MVIDAGAVATVEPADVVVDSSSAWAPATPAFATNDATAASRTDINKTSGRRLRRLRTTPSEPIKRPCTARFCQPDHPIAQLGCRFASPHCAGGRSVDGATWTRLRPRTPRDPPGPSTPTPRTPPNEPESNRGLRLPPTCRPVPLPVQPGGRAPNHAGNRLGVAGTLVEATGRTRRRP